MPLHTAVFTAFSVWSLLAPTIGMDGPREVGRYRRPPNFRPRFFASTIPPSSSERSILCSDRFLSIGELP